MSVLSKHFILAVLVNTTKQKNLQHPIPLTSRPLLAFPNILTAVTIAPLPTSSATSSHLTYTFSARDLHPPTTQSIGLFGCIVASTTAATVSKTLRLSDLKPF